MGFKKENKDKELVCRPCGKFLDSNELDDGKCPECGDDEGIFMNDLNIDE
jgi:rubrerythrin